MNVHQVVQQAEQLMEQYLEDLKTTVNIDSGTYTKRGIDRVGAYLQERFQTFGFSTRIDRQEQYGNHLVTAHTGNAPQGPRILLIGHIDTVFPAGEVERRPFAISQQNGRHIATGPGVLDMKSGVLIGLYGLHILIEAQQANYQSVTFVCNSDEEIGSPSSRPLIEELARQSDAAIVLEPRRGARSLCPCRGRASARAQCHPRAFLPGAEDASTQRHHSWNNAQRRRHPWWRTHECRPGLCLL